MTEAAPNNGEYPTVLVEGVNHFFGESESKNQILFNNSIEIPAGQLVIMTGPSGSGKTTLLTLIGALRSVQSGRIEVLGKSLQGLQGNELVAVRRNIGFIFQMHNLFDSLSAFENVKMAMQISDCPASDMRKRGMEILERLGLGHRVDHKPKMLSGGQRQRVAVARALVNKPKLILADEPTAALDKESSKIVVELLKELTTQEGCAVVMVTHDYRILEVADRIVNMVDGSIRSDVLVNDAVIICQFLRTIDLFKNMTPYELTNIAEKMIRRDYRGGEIIIREGDPGEEFFLIEQGQVDVIKRSTDSASRHLAALSTGEVFGERALIADEPRNATCTAASDKVAVFVLKKAEFSKALATSATFNEQLRSIYFQRQ
jgi:putative ABC transport system ATP-binding protein